METEAPFGVPFMSPVKTTGLPFGSHENHRVTLRFTRKSQGYPSVHTAEVAKYNIRSVYIKDITEERMVFYG